MSFLSSSPSTFPLEHLEHPVMHTNAFQTDPINSFARGSVASPESPPADNQQEHVKVISVANPDRNVDFPFSAVRLCRKLVVLFHCYGSELSRSFFTSYRWKGVKSNYWSTLRQKPSVGELERVDTALAVNRWEILVKLSRSTLFSMSALRY